MQDPIFCMIEKRMTSMNKLLVAMGLAAALGFSAPAFQVSAADAATTQVTKTQTTTHATAAATVKKHVMKCKPSKTHKCPVLKKKKK